MALEEVLKTLLHPRPHTRMTAAELLESDYFTHSPPAEEDGDDSEAELKMKEKPNLENIENEESWMRNTMTAYLKEEVAGEPSAVTRDDLSKDAQHECIEPITSLIELSTVAMLRIDSPSPYPEEVKIEEDADLSGLGKSLHLHICMLFFFAGILLISTSLFCCVLKSTMTTCHAC